MIREIPGVIGHLGNTFRAKPHRRALAALGTHEHEPGLSANNFWIEKSWEYEEEASVVEPGSMRKGAISSLPYPISFQKRLKSSPNAKRKFHPTGGRFS